MIEEYETEIICNGIVMALKGETGEFERGSYTLTIEENDEDRI